MLNHMISRMVFERIVFSLLAAIVAPSDAFAAVRTDRASTGPAVAEKVSPPLHFLRAGKGPAVVFLHGLGGDSTVWLDELAQIGRAHV